MTSSSDTNASSIHSRLQDAKNRLEISSNKPPPSLAPSALNPSTSHHPSVTSTSSFPTPPPFINKSPTQPQSIPSKTQEPQRQTDDDNAKQPTWDSVVKQSAPQPPPVPTTSVNAAPTTVVPSATSSSQPVTSQKNVEKKVGAKPGLGKTKLYIIVALVVAVLLIGLASIFGKGKLFKGKKGKKPSVTIDVSKDKPVVSTVLQPSVSPPPPPLSSTIPFSGAAAHATPLTGSVYKDYPPGYVPVRRSPGPPLAQFHYNASNNTEFVPHPSQNPMVRTDFQSKVGPGSLPYPPPQTGHPMHAPSVTVKTVQQHQREASPVAKPPSTRERITITA